MSRISNEDFKNAEKIASENNLHISSALERFYSDNGEIKVVDIRKVIELVKPRPENSHKGSFGRLVLIAGSDRFPGAVQLAALSALRSGVGLVTAVTTRLAATALAVNAKEATLLPLSSDIKGFMTLDKVSADVIAELVKKADALLIGPGLGTGEMRLKVLKIALENAACPIILDADGINLVCGRIELLRKAKTDLILTPHPAELARLSGVPLKVALSDRLFYAQKLSLELNCTVVSKSAGTLIVAKDNAYLSARGNNGLSRGGSGDMLAGLIASFAAQGHSPVDSALIGVTVQGLACEYVSEETSRRGMIPSDIISSLPMLFKKIERLI